MDAVVAIRAGEADLTLRLTGLKASFGGGTFRYLPAVKLLSSRLLRTGCELVGRLGSRRASLSEALDAGQGKQVNGVMVRCLFAVVVGMVLIVSACTAAQAPSKQAGPLPPDCASRVTEAEQARAALAQVRPGSRVCLSGEGLAATELEVTTSGTPQQPITIVADGAVIRSMTVNADYVVIQGLALKDGDGLTMSGRDLIARNNVIYNAVKDGLVCRNCVDTILESNTVQRADGTGIWFSGERVTVRNNTVSESVLGTQGDADGIHFFGVGHRLTGNMIRDIRWSGDGNDTPGGSHADCFRTSNSAHDPPTYDVVIAGNTCKHVDGECLAATTDDRGAGGAPAGQTAITFERNTCSVDGARAVLLRGFPHVIVRDNTFSGPGGRAVQLTEGSTDCAVIGNTLTGQTRPYEIDRRSEPGFQESGNTSR